MTLQQSHSSSSGSTTLVSSKPTASAPACVQIEHVQLRDLIVCPAERGIVWYVSENQIIEQDILSRQQQHNSNVLAKLPFTPVTLNALTLPQCSPSGDLQILLAAGGQGAELFLGFYSYSYRKRKDRNGLQSNFKHDTDNHVLEDYDAETDSGEDSPMKGQANTRSLAGRSTLIWNHVSALVGSINNNVLLYLPPPNYDRHGQRYSEPDRPHDSSVEMFNPRLVVSNNDCTVKFYEVSLAQRGISRTSNHVGGGGSSHRTLEPRYWRHLTGNTGASIIHGHSSMRHVEGIGWSDRDSSEQITRYRRIGLLRLPVPVNHTSISPDGSTVLSCGDAATIYLHRILSSRDMNNELVFESLATYTIPVPNPPMTIPMTGESRRPPSPHPDSPTYLPYAFVNGAWTVLPVQYMTNIHSFGTNNSNAFIHASPAPPACFATAWNADGTRFAVAGQEGAVRVWDVRCKEPLEGACWETGPSEERAGVRNRDLEEGTMSFSGLPGYVNHAGMNELNFIEAESSSLPWGVRALRFSRNPSGKEVLVFTEHVSRVHIVDADTFHAHDILRIPHVQLQSHTNNTSSSTSLPSMTRSGSRPFPSTPYSRFPFSMYPPPTIQPSSDSSLDSVIQSREQAPRSTEPLGWRSSRSLDHTATPRRPVRQQEQVLEASIIQHDRPYNYDRVLPSDSGNEQFDSSRRNEERAIRILPDNNTFTRSPEPESVEINENIVPNPALTRERSNLTPAFTAQSRIRRVVRAPRAGEPTLPIVEADTETFNTVLRSLQENQGNDPRLRESQLNNSRNDGLRFSQEYLASLENLSSTSYEDESRASSRLYDGPRNSSRRDPEYGYVPWTAQTENQELSPESRERRDVLVGRIRSLFLTDPAYAQTYRSNRWVGSSAGREMIGERRERTRNIDNTSMEEDISFHEIADRNQSRGLEDAPRVIRIPPLSSTRSEEDVRNILAAHGIVSVLPRDNVQVRSGMNTSSNRESLTSSSNSRTVGPSNESNVPRTLETHEMEIDDNTRPAAERSSDTGIPTAPEALLSSSSTRIPLSSSSPHPPGSQPTSPSAEDQRGSNITSSSSQQADNRSQPTLPPCIELIESTDPLDIAGVCFDPTGTWMYVATADGITEWSIKGANQCWWASGGLL